LIFSLHNLKSIFFEVAWFQGFRHELGPCCDVDHVEVVFLDHFSGCIVIVAEVVRIVFDLRRETYIFEVALIILSFQVMFLLLKVIFIRKGIVFLSPHLNFIDKPLFVLLKPQNNLLLPSNCTQLLLLHNLRLL
jgi:hypothetical protein